MTAMVAITNTVATEVTINNLDARLLRDHQLARALCPDVRAAICPPCYKSWLIRECYKLLQQVNRSKLVLVIPRMTHCGDGYRPKAPNRIKNSSTLICCPFSVTTPSR